MKELKIEWKHYDKEGETCTRCNNTGDSIKTVLDKISEDKTYKDIKLNYKEIKLGKKDMSDSNTVLINGKNLEDILNASASENFCHSCTCLAGENTNCRTVEYDGKIYEDLSEEMIFDAIRQAINDDNIG